MASDSKGKTSSIWFKNDKEVRRIKQAAKVADISPNELMRSASLAEAERVIAKAKRKAAAEAA